MMEMFRDAVKAGNAGAKVMGPSCVSISPGVGEDPVSNNLAMGEVYRWLTGGVPADGLAATRVEFQDGPDRAAKNFIDGFMFHPYNFMVGDFNSGRYELENMDRLLKKAGVGDLPRWQGEFGQMTPVYGLYMPRKARQQMLYHLILDQYGVPKERNNLWYDQSHGFWSFPGWWMNGDQSLNPHALYLRVMAEEVYGKTYTGRVDFGKGVGNNLFLGNLYTADDGSRAMAVVATSHLDNQTMVFQLSATVPGTITWRTSQGVTSTATVDLNGRVEVPITGTPTWLRLPPGTNAVVYSFLGLTSIDAPNLAGVNAQAKWSTAVTTPAKVAVDRKYQKTYNGNNAEVTIVTPPDNLVINLYQTYAVSDVVIFSGFAWQSQGTLLDFDVQTSSNGGSSWTTRATVTKTASSFAHGSDSSGTGTQRDTFWDEQWVFPVHLNDTPIQCNALRLVVRAASYGGNPDTGATAVGGQGHSNQRACITEVYVMGDQPPLIATV